MKVRDMAGACLEMANSEAHQYSSGEQFFKSGEKAKIIAAARCMPKGFLDKLLGLVRHDTLPLIGDAVSERPMAYGSEVIAYDVDLPSGAKAVLKLYHGRFDISETVRKSVTHQDLYERHFGDLVVPSQYFIHESQYGTGAPRLASIQPKVEGVCFFANPWLASRSSIAQLRQGVQTMSSIEGLLPDFVGKNNVLVEEAGGIYIVDCGNPAPTSEAWQTPDLVSRLALIESLDVQEQLLAS